MLFGNSIAVDADQMLELAEGNILMLMGDLKRARRGYHGDTEPFIKIL
jgi:hypothetical protein